MTYEITYSTTTLAARGARSLVWDGDELVGFALRRGDKIVVLSPSTKERTDVVG
jgi:hypothetical protein